MTAVNFYWYVILNEPGLEFPKKMFGELVTLALPTEKWRRGKTYPPLSGRVVILKSGFWSMKLNLVASRAPGYHWVVKNQVSGMLC